MNKILLLLAIASLVYSCNSDKKAGPVAEAPVTEKPLTNIDSTLITDSSWGLINKNTDITGMQQLFGAGNIKDERICGPECADSVDVTTVYPGKNNEFVVYWQDSAYHKKISFVESSRASAPYHTSSGLKVGSTLTDIVKLNGRKITFSGFGWDYGGTIQSYNNGTLEKSSLIFHLDLTDNDDRSLFGDKELNTDMPSVKKALDKIVVYQVSLSFFKGE